MNKQFEAILEGQKQAIDFWSKMSDQYNQAFKSNGNSKKEEPKLDFVSEWLNQQQQLWQAAMQIGDPQKAFQEAPEQFRKWVEINQSYVENWTSFAKNNADKLGISWPGSTDFYSKNQFEQGIKQWNTWIDQSAQALREQLMTKLPFGMQAHFNSFLKSYDGLYQYWETFIRMIQNGLIDPSIIDKYFSQQAYQKLINELMGFQPIGNVSELIDGVNRWFEKLLSAGHASQSDFSSISENWQNKMKGYWTKESIPFFQMANEFNQQLRDQLLPFYNLMAQGRAAEIARLQRDMQFGYISYILKTAELQTKVYESGQFVLPDLIRTYYKEFQNDKTLPEYEDFFKAYINKQEEVILEVLHSDAYSSLQSEVAATGTQLKYTSEKMMELAMNDLPFLTKSEGDDFAKENAALRRKIRSLEQRLTALEEQSDKGITSDDPKKKLFEVIGTAKAAEKDDLKAIKGIGPKLEKLLNKTGIYSYRQISKMTKTEYALIDQLMDTFQGRASRDHWAEQATQLLNA